MKSGVQKQKKIPTRRCTGCGESFPKKDLIRVVRSPEGELSIDFTGKKSGRGAYICQKTECFRKAMRGGRLSRSLGVPISPEIYDSLEHEVALSEARSDD